MKILFDFPKTPDELSEDSQENKKRINELCEHIEDLFCKEDVDPRIVAIVGIRFAALGIMQALEIEDEKTIKKFYNDLLAYLITKTFVLKEKMKDENERN